MISGTLIKILYVLGMIGITIAGIMVFVQASNLIGLAIIIFGNLLWRIFCEGLVLLFSIHDTLNAIEKKIK